MAELFDDLSRIVGSGIPRRRMLKLIAITFAGGALPALWPTRAAALVGCGPGYSFYVPCDAEVTAQNCSSLHGTELQNVNIQCCEANRVKAEQQAQSKCPNACPIATPAGAVNCHGTCNGNKFTCTSNDPYQCGCDAPVGWICCGRNAQGIVVYCFTATQKCCGNYCREIGKPCQDSPG
jgi:hypothetical protein